MLATIYPPETTSGVVTSWIPLTTVFASSLGCSNSYRLEGPSLVAFDPRYGIDIDSNVNCQPPEVTAFWDQGFLGSGSDYTIVSILPLTCPEGWKTLATSTRDHSSTLATCCPPGYYLENGSPREGNRGCLSNVKAGMVLTYASITLDDSTTSWDIVTSTLDSSLYVRAVSVAGWNIADSTTKPLASTSASTSSSTSTPSVNSAPSSADSSLSSTPLPSSPPISLAATSSGLSTGAKAGIGVAGAFGVLGLIALIIAAYLYGRRKQSHAPPGVPLETAGVKQWQSELASPYQYEVGSQPNELPGDRGGELPAGNVSMPAAELEWNPRRR